MSESPYGWKRCLKHNIEYPKWSLCSSCLKELHPVIERKKSDAITQKEAEDLGRHGDPGPRSSTGPIKEPAQKTEAQVRKQHPMFSGLMKYFPRSLRSVSNISWIGNEQHNPGQPLHWSRGKSSDHLDCALRHINDYATGKPVDTDGGDHLAKAAWRIHAQHELDLEAKELLPK